MADTHHLSIQILIPRNILGALMRYGLDEDQVFSIDPALFSDVMPINTTSLKLRFHSVVYHHGKAGTYYRAQVTFFIRKDKRMVIEVEHRIKTGTPTTKGLWTSYGTQFYKNEADWNQMIKDGQTVTGTVNNSKYWYNIQFIATNTTYTTNKDILAGYLNPSTGVLHYLAESTYGGVSQAKSDLQARYDSCAYDPTDSTSRHYPTARHIKSDCIVWTKENQGDLIQEFNDEMDSKLEMIINTIFRSTRNTYWGKYYEEILSYSNILQEELGFSNLRDYQYHIQDINANNTDASGNIVDYTIRCKVRTQEGTGGVEEVSIIVPRRYFYPGMSVTEIERILKEDISRIAKEKLLVVKADYQNQKSLIEAHLTALGIFIRDNIFDDATKRNLSNAYTTGVPKYTVVTLGDAYNENLEYYVNILGEYYQVTVTESNYESYINSIGLYTVATYVQVISNSDFSSLKTYYQYSYGEFIAIDDVNKTNFDVWAEKGIYYLLTPEPVFYEITSVDYIVAEYSYYIKVGKEYQEVIITDDNQEYYVKQGLYCRIKPEIKYYKVLQNQPYREDIDYYQLTGLGNYSKSTWFDETSFKSTLKTYDNIYSTSKNLTIYKKIDSSYQYDGNEIYYVLDRNLNYIETDVTEDNYSNYLSIGLYIEDLGITSSTGSTQTYYPVERYSKFDESAKYYVYWEGSYTRVTIDEGMLNTFISYGLYADKEPEIITYFKVSSEAVYDETAKYYILGINNSDYIYTPITILNEDYFTIMASTGSLYADKELTEKVYHLVGPEDDYIPNANYYSKDENGNPVPIVVNISNYDTLKDNTDLYCTTDQPDTTTVDEDGNIITISPITYYKAANDSIYDASLDYYRKVYVESKNKYTYEKVYSVDSNNFSAYVALGIYTTKELAVTEPTYYQVESFYKYSSTANYYMRDLPNGASASYATYILLDTVNEDNFTFYKTVGIWTDIKQEEDIKYYKMHLGCIYNKDTKYYVLVDSEYVDISDKVNQSNFANYISIGLYRNTEVEEFKKLTKENALKLSTSAEFDPELEYFTSLDGENFTYEEGVNETNFYDYINSIGLYIDQSIDTQRKYKATSTSVYSSSTDYTYYVLNSDGYSYTEVSVTIDNFDNYVKIGLYTNKKLPTASKSYIQVNGEYYKYDSSAEYYVYNGVAYTKIDIEDEETFTLYTKIGLYTTPTYKQDRPTTYFKAEENNVYRNDVAYYILDTSEIDSDKQYKRIYTVTEDNFYVYIAMGIYTTIKLNIKANVYYKVDEYYVYNSNAIYYFKQSTSTGNGGEAYQYIQIDVADEATMKTLVETGNLYTNIQQFPYFRITTLSIYNPEAKYYTLDTTTGVYTLIEDMNSKLFTLRAKLGTLYSNIKPEENKVEHIKVEDYYIYNANANYYSDIYGTQLINDIDTDNFDIYQEIGIWTDLKQDPSDTVYYRATERSQYLSTVQYYRYVESSELYVLEKNVNRSNFSNYVNIGIYTPNEPLPILTQEKFKVELWYEYDSTAKYYFNISDTVDEAIYMDQDLFKDYAAVGIYTDKKQTQPMNYKKITSEYLYSPSATYYVYDSNERSYNLVTNVTASNFYSYVILGLYTTSTLLKGETDYYEVLSHYSYDSTATYYIFNDNKYEKVEVEVDTFELYKDIGIYSNKHQEKPTEVNYYKVTHRHIFNPAMDYYTLNSNDEYKKAKVTITNYRAYIDVGIYSSPNELEIDETVFVYKVEKWYKYNPNATYYSDGYGYNSIEVTQDTFEPYYRIGIWTDVEQEKELKYYLCNDTVTYDALETYYIMVSDNTYIEVSVNQSNFKDYMSLGLYRKTEVQSEESPLSYQKCTSNSKYSSTAKYYTKGTDMIMKRITSVTEDNFSTYVSTVGLYEGIYE